MIVLGGVSADAPVPGPADEGIGLTGRAADDDGVVISDLRICDPGIERRSRIIRSERHAAGFGIRLRPERMLLPSRRVERGAPWAVEAPMEGSIACRQHALGSHVCAHESAQAQCRVGGLLHLGRDHGSERSARVVRQASEAFIQSARTRKEVNNAVC